MNILLSVLEIFNNWLVFPYNVRRYVSVTFPTRGYQEVRMRCCVWKYPTVIQEMPADASFTSVLSITPSTWKEVSFLYPSPFAERRSLAIGGGSEGSRAGGLVVLASILASNLWHPTWLIPISGWVDARVFTQTPLNHWPSATKKELEEENCILVQDFEYVYWSGEKLASSFLL